MNTKEVASNLLTTRGISSQVRESGGRPCGHVLLLDYDGDTSFARVMDDTANLPGVTALFESSPGSYHVWNTTLRTVDGTALAMLRLKCDPMHTSVGYRRGRWTLRVGPKNRVNASAGSEDEPEDYRTAPDPLKWWVNGTERAQSAPHISMLRALFGEAEITDRATERCPTRRGESYRVEAYLTMTDEMKTWVA